MRKSIHLLNTHQTNFQFSTLNPFHLAIPVNSLKTSILFYGQTIGCKQGRKCKNNTWIDYNFYGHQLVCHYVSQDFIPYQHCNDVDKEDVPVPHFGVCLDLQQWMDLRDRLVSIGIRFVVQPQLRFQGQKGEQWTMFFKDPTGNCLEFKAMTNPYNLFAKYEVE